MPSAIKGNAYASTTERYEAEERAWIEINAHAAKVAIKPTRRPNWLNPMGMDDAIVRRRLVEMPLTAKEIDDLCREQV